MSPVAQRADERQPRFEVWCVSILWLRRIRVSRGQCLESLRPRLKVLQAVSARASVASPVLSTEASRPILIGVLTM